MTTPIRLIPFVTDEAQPVRLGYVLEVTNLLAGDLIGTPDPARGQDEADALLVRCGLTRDTPWAPAGGNILAATVAAQAHEAAADMPAATPPPFDVTNLREPYYREQDLVLEEADPGMGSIVGRVDIDHEGHEYLACFGGCLAEVQLADGGLCSNCRRDLADSEDEGG